MSDRGPDISRRTLLYGLTTAGIGAGTGTVTAATLSDTESFTGNLLSSGEVDIETCWETENDSSACTPDDATADVDLGSVSTMGDGGSGLIRVELPDNDENNPAWVCLRASCPGDDTGLEEKLIVRVWRDENCDTNRDRNEELLAIGSLCEVLTTLNDGVLIDGNPNTDAPDPFGLGDNACIGFEWYLNEDLGADDSVDTTFDFQATQSRNVTPTDVCQERTSCTCDDDGTSESKAISFVCFCQDGGFDSQDPIISISTAETNTDGEPVAVSWESEEPVDTVVIKTGPGPDALYNFDVGGATFGRTELDTTTDSPDGGSNQSPSDPCPNSSDEKKYEYHEENETWVKE